MNNQFPKPREWWITQADPRLQLRVFKSQAEGISAGWPEYKLIHVLEATPRTLAADEMYEALERLVNARGSEGLEEYVQANREAQRVLAKARVPSPQSGESE